MNNRQARREKDQLRLSNLLDPPSNYETLWRNEKFEMAGISSIIVSLRLYSYDELMWSQKIF